MEKKKKKIDRKRKKGKTWVENVRKKERMH